MKKSELKTGQLIMKRSGECAIVLLGTENGDVYATTIEESKLGRTWGILDFLNEDLTYPDAPDADVMRVYSLPQNSGNMRLLVMSLQGRTLLYERDETFSI